MKNEINEGHYLELMDRLHVIMSILDEHCVNHPLAQKEKDIKFTLEYALGQLSDAYQEVGRKMVKKDAIQKVISRRRKNAKD